MHEQILRWGRESAGRKKGPVTEVQRGSNLKFQRRQEMWNQRNGPERRGGGEGRVVPQSLWPGLQEISASVSKRDLRIDGSMARPSVAPVSCSWSTEIHHRTAPECRESQPDTPAARGQVRTGNRMLSLTTLQKAKLLWCLVTEFNCFQSVITVQNHAWFVLWGVSPSGFFWPMHWKLSWKQLVYIGHQLLI